jgi:hypothetical protein
MKGLKDRKKLFRGGKKSSSMGQEFLKIRIIAGVGIGSTSNPPPPPLPTTQTEERLKDKGDPTRTKGMNEMITEIPNKIQNNPYYGARTSVYLFIFF